MTMRCGTGFSPHRLTVSGPSGPCSICGCSSEQAWEDRQAEVALNSKATAEFRIGDYVQHQDGGGPKRIMARDGAFFLVGNATDDHPFVWHHSMFRHCAPDPLPERLPKGTRYKGRGGAAFAEDAILGADGRWHAPSDKGTSAHMNECYIDWPSYWLALHAEQDAAKAPEFRCDVDVEWIGDDVLSPDERLARTVECGGCGARVGEHCRPDRGKLHDPSYHWGRLALAKQRQKDSGANEAGTGGTEPQRAGRAAGADSREGRALGNQPQPAAPSGFPKCPGLVDVGGKACGQEIRKPVGLIRITPELCGDCRASLDPAHNERTDAAQRKREQLRRDLDRPLPAEKTWPQAWSSAGWESDP